MQNIRIQTVVESFDSHVELPADEQELLESATAVMKNAYAPYSHFHVGAAVRLGNGNIVQGSNQENMAYPSGLCAERVAFYAAGAQNPGIPILKVAITAESEAITGDHPVAPCGACRQAMLEYELHHKQPITVILKGRLGKVYRIQGISQLLPLFFNEDGLKSR